MVATVAAETTALRGTPASPRPCSTTRRRPADRQVHRAAEDDNALAADTVLRLLRRPAAGPPRGPCAPARGARRRCPDAARARDVLAERLARPPSLEQLAAELGTSPFALLRAFKNAYGMPPHAWLTDARVRPRGACSTPGTTPADTAAAVGFTDQPHLNRHFTRIVGVPPGAYQRERKNVQDRAGTTAP